jgi:hypothetical protein
MPADGIPRCPSISNGDVGTSRLEKQLQEDYTIRRPPKRRHIGPGRGAARFSQKPVAPTSESGQKAKFRI